MPKTKSASARGGPTSGRKKLFQITVKPEWCKGCAICVLICPKKVLQMTKEPCQTGYFTACVVNPEDCIGCLECELHCPDLAITLTKN